MARVSITAHRQRSGGGGIRSDAAQVAEARVLLKLRSIAYRETRTGCDVGPELGGHAAAALCVAAINYYALLVSDPSVLPRLRQAWTDDVLSSRSSGQNADLRLWAVAYAGARDGSDSHSEFVRSAIGRLCQSAVTYCQSLLGRAPTDEVVDDDTISLDDGR